MPIAILCAIGAAGAFAQTTPTGTSQGAGAWTQKAPLPTTRNEVSLATVGGKVYVLGGSINRVSVPHVEEYDPATDKWNARMPMIRGLDHMGTAVVNGKIITVGGFLASVHAYPQALVYEYDPAANTWRALAPMKAPRASVGVALLDGKVHAIGGRTPDGKTLATHEVYDPATGTWSDAAPLPQARDHMALVAADGKIHAIGGRITSPAEPVALHDVRSGHQRLEPRPAAADRAQRRVRHVLQGPHHGAGRRISAAGSHVQRK